jgi:hypothetical protein
MGNRDGKSSGGGVLFLLGLCLAVFVAQYVATKPSAPPAATQAIMRFVKEGRRQAAIGSQESKEGYVIDPALAKRMLADTSIRVRITGLRGFSDHVVARATVTAPDADGSERSTVRYFALQRGTGEDWSATREATARDWYIKVW